jgi:hypothetical protein
VAKHLDVEKYEPFWIGIMAGGAWRLSLEPTAEITALGTIRGLDTTLIPARVPYVDEVQYAYAAADFVICRSGAMTCAESAAGGLPAAYIPLQTRSPTTIASSN